MIAAGRATGPRSWLRGEAIAPSLGLFAGGPASQFSSDGIWLACLHAPRAAPQRGWRPSLAADGSAVLFEGQIDNRVTLARQLALPDDSSNASLYGAAVLRWGAEADRHVIGSYAAIVARVDGSWRLSRSPWQGYSLFWAQDEGGFVAASIPRPIFAAGWPKRLRETALADLLFGIDQAESDDRFVGVHRVPQGSVVEIAPDGRVTTIRWYDPLALPHLGPRSDGEWVEATQGLLDEAARAAIAGFTRPGMLLSAGLDSPLAAEAVLRALPLGQSLPSFTFVPLPEWEDDSRADQFGSDRDGVLDFAQMHPRIEPHFSDNCGHDFDSQLDQLLAAGDAGYPSLRTSAIFHGPLVSAARAGCDVALTASWGNATYSNEAIWAYGEFARRGRWSELWRLAREHPGETRSMPRRLVARSLVPHLPRPLRRAVRSLVHGPQANINSSASLLRHEAVARFDLEARAAQAECTVEDEMPIRREDYVRALYHRADFGTELHHATEQVFGLRLRDVAAYRPLIEFCLALPTGQFVRHGEQRWLARRMAQGRLPEAQRLDRRYGRHNADWHLRLTRRLPEIRAEYERIAGDAELAALIDTEEALRRIDRWPQAAPTEQAQIRPLFQALTGGLVVARFWRHVSGSNG